MKVEESEEWKRLTRKYGIWVLLGIVLVPVLIALLFLWPAKIPVDANDIWLGFHGSYLGGIIGGILSGTLTLLGVRATIKSNQKDNKDQQDLQMNLFKEQLKNSNIQLEKQLGHERELFQEKLRYEEEISQNKIKEELPHKIYKLDEMEKVINDFLKDLEELPELKKVKKIAELLYDIENKILKLSTEVDTTLYNSIKDLSKEIDIFIKENKITIREGRGNATYHTLNNPDFESLHTKGTLVKAIIGVLGYQYKKILKEN